MAASPRRRKICMMRIAVAKGARKGLSRKIEQTPTVQKKRIDSIDFWRGVAQVAILVNHIPGNVLGAFTLRNFNFSDSAELFVFLSGVSVYLAYGEKFRRGSAGILALARRAAKLYGAHLGLTAVALALFWFANDFTPYDLLGAESGRATPFLDPVKGVVGILALSHQVAYFNILPLYIVLMSAAPLLLAAVALRGRFAMLAASAAVYGGARFAGINLPSWPEPGGWYFNPFAWQFMFALGIFCGGALREDGVPFRRGLLRLSLVLTILSGLVVSNAFGLAPGLVDEAGRYLDWNKSELGVARIVDFAALAYVVYFSKLNRTVRDTALFDFFALLGRNPLPVFCAGSLISALGQILSESSLASPLLDVLYVGTALLLLHGLAGLVDRAEPAFVGARAGRERAASGA